MAASIAKMAELGEANTSLGAQWGAFKATLETTSRQLKEAEERAEAAEMSNLQMQVCNSWAY